MEAKLIYNLPEDDWEFKRAVNGSNLHCAVTEFQNRMRSFLKHNDEATDAHQEFYDIFWEVLNEYNVDLE